MKNLEKCIFICLVAVFCACNYTDNTSELAADTIYADTVGATNAEAPLADTSPTLEEPAQEIADADSINFEKYQVALQKNVTKAALDFESYPGARDFKTRIIEAYQTNKVNFAGNYVTVTFGCGAMCIMGFMVDTRDGKIYDLPLGEENSCLFAEERALYDSQSRLFIAAICKEKKDSPTVYYNAYLWNEDLKKFEAIKASEFVK